MKKIMILGAVTCDIAAHVKVLPKGNEEFQSDNEEKRIAGNGYYIHQMIQGFGMDTDLLAPIGTGLYADYVNEEAMKLGLEFCNQSEEVEGCSYRLISDDGKQSSFVVPGGEYDFDSEVFTYLDSDDYSAIVVTADYLATVNADELLEKLEWFSCPMYFVPAGRLEEVEEDILQQILTISTDVFLTTEEIQYITNEESDLDQAIKHLREQYDVKVIVYSNTSGLIYHDDEEKMSSEDTTLSSLDERRLQCFAAYLVAIYSGVDIRNALVFAAEFVKRVDLNHGVMRAFDWEEQKQKLVRLITWKS